MRGHSGRLWRTQNRASETDCEGLHAMRGDAYLCLPGDSVFVIFNGSIFLANYLQKVN